MDNLLDLSQINNELLKEIAERKKAEVQLEQKNRLLSILLEVSNLVSSTMELKPLLESILDKLKLIIDYGEAKIFIIEDESIRVIAHRSNDTNEEENEKHLKISHVEIGEMVVTGKKPFVIDDIQNYPPMTNKYKDISTKYDEAISSQMHAWIGVPLIIKNKVIGLLTMVHKEPGYFKPGHMELGIAFANQAAIEFDNARMYEEGLRRHQENAVAAERSRLARDLHDSVTQTLFSSSLIAEVLPKIWKKNPGEGIKRLEEIGQLTKGALAEMRTLLLELRPATLVEANLFELLKQLSEATAGRARLPVRLNLEANILLPVDVKIAFYRIAQEALNNIAKHSGATDSAVILRKNTNKTKCCDVLELIISDNGRGFDPNNITGEHLGVGIMRERAVAIGGILIVESHIGRGTDIIINWDISQK